MSTHATQIQESKTRPTTNVVNLKQADTASSFQFMDNRSETSTQRNYVRIANNSSKFQQVYQLHTMANDYSNKQKIYTPERSSNEGLAGIKPSLAAAPQNKNAVQRMKVMQLVSDKQLSEFNLKLSELWKEGEEKEAILNAIEIVFQKEGAVEATKDPLVVKAVLDFVNKKQSPVWQSGTKRKNAKDGDKLINTEKWTLRHYTDKYIWNDKSKQVDPPHYNEILSSLTLAAIAKSREKSIPEDESTKGKVGAAKSGHTSLIDWKIIGNVGDTFYGLFYDGKIAGAEQTFLKKAQWFAEWKLDEVPEIWGSSDWLGKAKEKNAVPRGEAYEGNPKDVISTFLGLFGRRGDGDSQRKFFTENFDNFEVKVHGALRLGDKGWQRVPEAPRTPEES